MKNQIKLLSIISLVCTSLIAGENPYALAGYGIENGASAWNVLNLPPTVMAYEWNVLNPNQKYQMVRPFHCGLRAYRTGKMTFNYGTLWQQFNATGKPCEWFNSRDSVLARYTDGTSVKAYLSAVNFKWAPSLSKSTPSLIYADIERVINGRTYGVRFEINISDSVNLTFNCKVRNKSSSVSGSTELKSVTISFAEFLFDLFNNGSGFTISPSCGGNNDGIMQKEITLTFSGNGLLPGNETTSLGNDIDNLITWEERNALNRILTNYQGYHLFNGAAGIGLPDKWLPQWYKESTKISSHVDTLRKWITRNPGKRWFIGNEPDDMGYQDGLTPDEFAVFYKSYYDTIKKYDPTAQCIIGAFSGMINNTGHQWEDKMPIYLDSVLSCYRNRFGTNMPIDVWNIHAYYGAWPNSSGPNAQELITRLVDPFLYWKDTVQNKSYKNEKVIISEFGVGGGWKNDSLTQKMSAVKNYMNALCPILEKKVDKFFWFYIRECTDPGWWGIHLIDYNKDTKIHSPTILGNAYSERARRWDSLQYAWEADGITAGWVYDNLLCVISKNKYFDQDQTSKSWPYCGRFDKINPPGMWCRDSMPKVDGKVAWDNNGYGITAAFTIADTLTVISNIKFWKQNLKTTKWIASGWLTNHPYIKNAPGIGTDSIKPWWSPGVTASYTRNNILTIISKNLYWNYDINTNQWSYAGNFNTLDSNHPWKKAAPQGFVFPWQGEGITASWMVDNNTLVLISSNKFWNLNLGACTDNGCPWTAVGNFDDLPATHPWKQMSRVKKDSSLIDQRTDAKLSDNIAGENHGFNISIQTRILPYKGNVIFISLPQAFEDQEMKISMFTLSGRSMSKKEGIKPVNGGYRASISDLISSGGKVPAGLYFITVECAGQKAVSSGIYIR